MNTILTDDERQAIAKPYRYEDGKLDGTKYNSVDPSLFEAIEAAVLAKLAQQAPVAIVRTWNKNGYQHAELWDWGLGLAAMPDGTHKVYTHPAPQQADRQRVPDGWIGVVQAARDVLSDAEDHLAKPHSTAVRVALMQLDAMLAAAPEAPAQASAADDLHTEAIAEGFESVADYVAYLKKSKDTYFAERNSARDAARRNREAPAQASAMDERAAFEVWWKSEHRLKSDSAAQAREAFHAGAAHARGETAV